MSFFQAFEYVLSIFIWCFSIGFPNEILCRFTVFNVLMDLFRFFKKKVLISLIATSVFTGLTYFLSFYFLYYKGIEYKNVGLLITQIIAGGATGFYYNVIYYLTGNIWITIILNSLSNFNLDYQEQLIIRLDISREYFLTIIYIITYFYLASALGYSILLYINKIKCYKKKEQVGNESQNFFLVTTNKNQFE